MFEASARLGGHTHTVDVTLDGVTAPVDTGFLVFNDRTYPHLIALFDELGVPSTASEMCDAVRAQGFSERFIRCWRFYLAYCAAGFASGSDVAQYTLVAR